MGLDYRLANFIAIVFGKLFAYITNKLFVFNSKTKGIIDCSFEFVKFILARGFTGILDFFGVIFLVEIVGIESIPAKYALQVVVIVLNYVLGKWIVFNKQ
jgi:putative flippase GtrA